MKPSPPQVVIKNELEFDESNGLCNSHQHLSEML